MTYPNFDLIEYKFKDKVNKERWANNIMFLLTTFKFDAFMQTWANTATGFDDGGCCAGQALTDEYTTVCEMSWYEKVRGEDGRWHTSDEGKIYGVFFGNDFGYAIMKPNELFFEDLKNRRMKSIASSDLYVKKR